MELKKQIPFFIFIAVFSVILTICSLSYSGFTAYAGEGMTIIKQSAFQFMPDKGVDSVVYANGKTGATVRVSLTQDQANEILEIKYFFVYIKAVSDEVTRDENGETYKNGAKISEDDVDGKAKKQAEVKKYSAPTINKDSYFDVNVKKWSALVIDIKYDGGGNEEWSYNNKNIYYITNIDNSAPKAYKNSFVYKENGFEFDIEFTDKNVSAVTAVSGIKSIDIRRETASGEERIFYNIKIASADYNYPLSVSSDITGTYYAYLTDYVGNYVKVKLFEMSLAVYNSDFESALENAFEEFESVADYYTKESFDTFKKAYYDYKYYVQEYASSGTDEKDKWEKSIKERMKTLTALMKDFSDNEKLRAAGEKNIEIEIANKEFLDGDIELINVAEAFPELLYGQTTFFNFSLAEFDNSNESKKEEIRKSGLTNITKMLSITLSTMQLSGKTDKVLVAPLKIKVPMKNYGKIVCIIKTYDEDGGEVYKTAEIKEYKSYIIINMPNSNGVITVCFGEEENEDLLWLLVLLIIPLGLAMFFIIRHSKIKKNKANEQKKKEYELKQAEQLKEKNNKPIPKNKKKKKK